MNNDRRGFFKKIFGGIAAIALAPKVSAIKLPEYERKFVEYSLPLDKGMCSLSGIVIMTGFSGIFNYSGIISHGPPPPFYKSS